MKQLGILIALAASSTAIAAPTPGHLSPITTSKSVSQFGGCFVAAQERAGLAWSYVPKPHGGTFSNVGNTGATGLYFLAVSDRGSARELRLEPAAPASSIDARVSRAVSRCA